MAAGSGSTGRKATPDLHDDKWESLPPYTPERVCQHKDYTYTQRSFCGPDGLLTCASRTRHDPAAGSGKTPQTITRAFSAA